MDDRSFNIRVPKKWVRVAMIVGVTALIVAPLTAIATHSFTDVPNSNTFHGDIAAIADAGVTKGCNPPDNTEYCPDDFVTRGQMAAFMNRLGALGPGQTPVANAATAVEADHADTADNADTLDGNEASDFVQKGEANTVTAAMTTAEPGASQSSNDGSVGVTVNTVILSTTLEAPADGFVLVMGSAEFLINHTNGTGDNFQFGVSNTSELQDDQQKSIIVSSALPTHAFRELAAAQKVFPVTAGSHEFNLIGNRLLGGTGSAEDSTLSAVFIPSAYGSFAVASTPGNDENATD